MTTNRTVIIRRADAIDAIEQYRRTITPIPAATQAAADLILIGAGKARPAKRQKATAKR